MSVADKLGALPGLGEVWNYGPWWAFFIALGFGWIAMNMIALLIELRVLIPHEQYYSFYYGDLVLPIAVGLDASLASDLHGGWYQANWFQWLALGLGLVGGLGQVALEIKNRQYTVRQFLSPTKIWHNLILWPVMAYWLITGTAAVTSADGPTTMKYVVVLTCLTTWVMLCIYDADPKHAKPNAHVGFRWLDWLACAGQPGRSI